jgi:hypothetical protein
MGGAEIVGVENEQFRVGGVAEALGYGFSLGRKRGCKQKRCSRESNQ